MRTRDVGEVWVGVGRIVGRLSRSLVCCRRSCTPPLCVSVAELRASDGVESEFYGLLLV